VLPIIAHIVAAEWEHCHRVTTNNANLTCCSSSCFRTHNWTYEYTVIPALWLIYKRSKLCTAAAEYECWNRNTVWIFKFRWNARAVNSRSCKSWVWMCALFFACLTVPRVTLPVNCVCRWVLIKTFPPYSVVIKVKSYICKDCTLLCWSKSVRVRLFVSTRCYTEETVFRVDSIKASVRTFLNPRNIVTYAPYFVTFSLISFRWDKHSKVCLTASWWECSADILNIAVWLLKAEDKHMFSLPTFVLTKVWSYTKSKALLTEKYISAVSWVNRNNSVIFRELANPSLFRINITFAVHTTYPVVWISKSVKNFLAYSCHNVHIKNNIDWVCDFDTDFWHRWTNRTHWIRDDIHCSAFIWAGSNVIKHLVALIRSHPVVSRTCILFLCCADKSSIFNTSNIVFCCSVKVAIRKKLIIKLYHFACFNSFFFKSVDLFLWTVNP